MLVKDIESDFVHTAAETSCFVLCNALLLSPPLLGLHEHFEVQWNDDDVAG